MSKTTNQNRRPSFNSSTESSMRKRHGPPSSSSSVKPISNTAVMVAKKRAPLGNITNQRKDSRIFPNSSSADSAHCPNKSAKLKLAPPTQPVCVNACETKSTCDSYKSPIEEVSAVERKAFSNLHITPSSDTTTNVRRDVLSETENKEDKFMNIDNDDDADPQLCATFACDIYNHLRAAEAKKQPAVDYMETLQKDVNSTMRGILVDWLVEVSEEYRLVPETLYLTVNYIDRYLSGNVISRQKLQLLGVACMMIAAKYEEVCAPQVEEFCYITDNTYLKDEVLDMESAVLNYLKFEMSAPTVKCFLRRFSRAAQGVHEAPCMQLECMASYIAELSLLEYTMLSHPPSLVAASAIFLAKYTLDPTRRPWNSTLRHYTQYEAMELRGCVMDLQRLCSNAHVSTLPAVRDKYSQHKYKFVAKKFCPSIIPPEFFKNS